MIDIIFLKAMTKIEFKQKALLLILVSISILLIAAFSHFFSKDLKQAIPLWGVVGYFWLLICSGNPFTFNAALNGTNPYGELHFSWKYLFSIIKDKHKYITSYSLSLIPFILIPSSIIALCMLLGFGVPKQEIVTVSILMWSYLISGIVFRVTSLIFAFQGIEFYAGPKSTYIMIKMLLWSMTYFFIYASVALSPYIVFLLSSSFFTKILLFTIWNGINLYFFYTEVIKFWDNESIRHPFLIRNIGRSFLLSLNIVFAFAILFVSVTTKTSFSQTIATLFSKKPTTVIFKDYSKNDPRLNANFFDGLTPLLYAINAGDLKSSEELIAKGADINAKTIPQDITIDEIPPGYPPIIFAIEKGQTEIASMLLEKGADLSIRTERGSNALHIASKMCDIKLIGLLIKKGVPLNEFNRLQRNPLWYTLGNKPCISGAYLLIKSGANPNLPIESDKSFYDFAKNKNQHFYNELMYFLNESPNRK